MKFTILTIDDEENIRNGLADNFELEGYEVKQAASGKEGLQLIEKGDIDLVITDLRMDGIDTAIGTQGEGDAIGTGLHGRIDQEAATRKSEDARLEGRIADIEGLIGGEEGSASLKELNDRLKDVEAEQLVQNQSIADNAAAIAAIVALEEQDIDAAFAAVFQ
jgi:hypothetical protein